MQPHLIALRAALAAGALAITGPAVAAQAAVSVDASGTTILVTGTSAADSLTITAGTGQQFRLSDAVVAAGSACQADGSSVVCDATGRQLRVELGDGADRLDNRSHVGGTFHGGAGSDVLRNAPTQAVASELQGNDGDDFLVIGSSLGPDVAFGNNGTDMVDYLERTSGPVFAAVEVDDRGGPPIANDGGPGENDNVAAEIIRGTAQPGDDLAAALADGDLGADKLSGGVAFELVTPYPRPAGTGPGRTEGVTVDLPARTTSDGDALGFPNRVVGTSFADTLVAHGTVTSSFEGLAGDDTFHARENADRFDGGDGSDIVTYKDAAKAVDAILGSGGEFPAEVNNTSRDRIRHVERLVGSPFGDHLVGSTATDVIEGGAGSDRIEDGDGAARTDTLDGGPGSDVVDYSRRSTTIVADLSSTLPVQAGAADKAEDRISGFEGGVGGTAADWLIGGEGDDVLRGGPGNDLIQGRGGADRLFGDDGRDLASYGERTLGVSAGLASGSSDGDTFAALEGICGSPGNDKLSGGGLGELLIGLGGDDTLQGNGGADRLIGDQPGGSDATPFPACTFVLVSGRDTVSYAGRTLGVNVSLPSAPIKLTNSDGDFIDVNVENLTGGNGSDKLIGNFAANVIDGGANNDLIMGADGDDVLRGGLGNDNIGQFDNIGTADAPKFVAETSPKADGVDNVSGGGGDDQLSTVDAVKDDQVLCGSGTDRAAIDLLDPAAAIDCETQQRGQIDVHPMQAVARASQARKRITLTVVCPRVQTRQIGKRCKGTVVIRRGRNGARLGSARYSIRQGTRGKVAVAVRASSRKGLYAVLIEIQRNKRKRVSTIKLG